MTAAGRPYLCARRARDVILVRTPLVNKETEDGGRRRS